MSYKVLIADDSITIQKLVELVLIPEGFDIKAFSDGEQAIQGLGGFSPDIVLADVEMPKLNGYQLCDRIKQNPSTSHIPVILLAGAFEPFDEGYARSIGADGFIIKPFESQELISKIKGLLSKTVSKTGKEDLTGSMSTEVELKEGVTWDEDIPIVAEEKTESVEPLSEEIEAIMATSDETFKLSEKETLSKNEFMAEVKESIEGRISAELISKIVKETLEQRMSDIIPDVIRNVMIELMKDISSSIENTINEEIRKVIPEIAENLIKKEIDKIVSEI